MFVVNSSGWILSVGVVKLDESLLYTWGYVIDRGIRNGFDFEKNRKYLRESFDHNEMFKGEFYNI